MDHVDCVVVGAGAVGLAIAREMARSGRQVLCLEAGETLGVGTSGRGSGVIHAGLYYPKGSLKARFCVTGKQLLYDFAEVHGVPCLRRGKLVVATSEAEDEELGRIAERAVENGVTDLVRIDGAEARRLEPALRCTSALVSPSTGVIDVGALLEALRADAEEFGAVTAFCAPVEGVNVDSSGFTLEIGGAAPMRISCRQLVNAAGHGASALARRTQGLDGGHAPQTFLAKGNYFGCDAPVPFTRLIYPLPVPGGIGTHLTIDPSGVARFGPDVEWVKTLDYVVDPSRADSFARDIRRWWPELPEESLRPAYSGIRPKLAGPGAPARDFVIEGEADHGVAGLVNLFGIESPGVTSCLAIAAYVATLLPA